MSNDFDVSIVGYGPVGSMLAILLGKKGYKVGVFERWPGLYPLPRAIAYDDEVARMLRLLCDPKEIASITENLIRPYEWKNGAGDVLLTINHPEKGPSGLPFLNFFNQPDLEQILDRVCQSLPTVTLFKGFEAIDLIEKDNSVELTVVNGKGEQQVFSSTYLVGCDGANSLVRKKMNVEYTDLGFAFTWLVIDIIPYDQENLEHVFTQLCDPIRPTTMIPSGPGRRRWEFMVLPGETAEELNKEETAWELLKPWGLTKDNCDLVRHAVYTFRGAWAESWRKGKVMIAGDAAHLTPPFLAQGLCSGLRDAWNLAWKLDLVLQNISDEEILDFYTEERNPNVQGYIHMGVELGKVICVTDIEQAAQRDSMFLSGKVPPLPPFPHVTSGVLYRCCDEEDNLTGRLSIQGMVEHDGKIGLIDDIVGSGWTIITMNADPRSYLQEEQILFLEQLGAQFITITNDTFNVSEFIDLDGTYQQYFNENGIEVIINRPDFYIFGKSTKLEDLPLMIDVLMQQVRFKGISQKTEQEHF